MKIMEKYDIKKKQLKKKKRKKLRMNYCKILKWTNMDKTTQKRKTKQLAKVKILYKEETRKKNWGKWIKEKGIWDAQ